MNKKPISDVVATPFIILLVVAAIAIIGAIVLKSDAEVSNIDVNITTVCMGLGFPFGQVDVESNKFYCTNGEYAQRIVLIQINDENYWQINP